MTRFRIWLAWLLLDLVRRVYPGSHEKTWQIIEVPRRITETEARELAEMVKNL